MKKTLTHLSENKKAELEKITVRADTCKTPEGITVEPYYVLEYPDWAHVIAINSNNQIIDLLRN